ncbi:MAG: septal ring lytic transglycosylase RlpA family protein [Desulfohalobiaceae bacterium]|nr:septal ring lytic transglycosylase RlpA family protein [Desulfohalobiaceae bacterium]
MLNIPFLCKLGARDPRRPSPLLMLGVLWLALLLLLFSACAPGKHSPTGSPAEISPSLPSSEAESFVQTGMASWYGPGFHGQQTACGETYDMYAFTAAHKRLPCQSTVRVVNLENGREVLVRITDRGPFRKNRILDLSYSAAKRLGVVEPGTARVRIATVNPEVSGEQGFRLQLGSFTERENARHLKRKAKALGLPGIRITRVQISGQRFYRVLTEGFTSLQEARAALRKARSRFPDSFILRN